MSFHPLTGAAAVSARHREAPDAAVLTVVTDLIRPHAAWRCGKVDRILVPSAAIRRRWRLEGPAGEPACAETGLPVTSEFWDGPALPQA